jgi:hypothetical protein
MGVPLPFLMSGLLLLFLAKFSPKPIKYGRNQSMDIDKLRRLSQEGQKNIERYCNPQQIAQEIIRMLEIEATKCAKAGKKDARVGYTIWSEDYCPKSYMYEEHKEKEGPLVNCADRRDLSRVLFDVVKSHIEETDNRIQLKFNEFHRDYSAPRGGFYTGVSIVAILSW